MIQSLEELIVPGRILRLFCSFTEPPKEKFVVIAATKPFCLGLLINSNPTALQRAKKHLMEELVSVSAADGYTFLRNRNRPCSIVLSWPIWTLTKRLHN